MSSVTEPVAEPIVEPIGYPQLGLGLNNQKMALYGLFNKAVELKRPLVLPYMTAFDAATNSSRDVEISQVYSVENLKNFAAGFGITLLEGPPIETDNGWNCFVNGAGRLGYDAIRGAGVLDEFTCVFFRNLVPVITSTPLFRKLEKAVFEDRGIRVVSQLRIEKDWQQIIDSLATEADLFEDYSPGFEEIMAKTRNTLGAAAQTIYVVCDEANLPVSKDEIRETVRQKFGISLIWKSDILDEAESAQLSLLDLSIIDFEMSVRAPIFVGLSRSTFSNLAIFEFFCRTGVPPRDHYIYNFPGPTLARRYDFGAHVDVREATNKLYLREPLVENGVDQCEWPAVLTVHLSGIGDFITQSGTVPGTHRGHITAGLRGSGRSTIEGFSLQMLPPLQVGIEYRAKLDDRSWTAWENGGGYVGSRGQNRSIIGFAARLKGFFALSYQVVCFGSFVGKAALVEADGEKGCFSVENEILEAMQIVFRPKKP